MLEIVVLPTPDGPKKIILGISFFSMIRLKILLFPIKCFCPTTLSNVLGLILSANGLICLPHYFLYLIM